MASDVGICNNALQKLGATRITSLTDGSTNANECNAVYAMVRDRELRKYTWSFAKTRIVLAPDATAPAWDYVYQFSLPSDWIRSVRVKADPNDMDDMTDYTIEQKKILTSDTTAIYLEYIYRVTDPNQMDELFQETLACALAHQLCEKLTESNVKKAYALQWYKDAVAEARRVNAIEKPPKDPPEDTYITERLG